MSLEKIVRSANSFENEKEIIEFLTKQYDCIGKNTKNRKNCIIFLNNKGYNEVSDYNLRDESSELRIYYEKDKKGTIKRVIIWPRGIRYEPVKFKKGIIKYETRKYDHLKKKMVKNHGKSMPCIILTKENTKHTKTEVKKATSGKDKEEKQTIKQGMKEKKNRNVINLISDDAIEQIIRHVFDNYDDFDVEIIRSAVINNGYKNHYKSTIGWKELIKDLTTIKQTINKYVGKEKEDEEKQTIICETCGEINEPGENCCSCGKELPVL